MFDKNEKHKATGGALKWTCCICYKESGDETKKDIQMFPLSKFKNSAGFCEKHTNEILINNKLSEYESMFEL